MITVQRAYATTADGRRIHYRRGGNGSPLVMLHASRGSSWMLEPLMTRLADQHTVIAIDTPGYGESEPLPVEHPSIANYAAALNGTLHALNITQCYLYGRHTGAKIALAYAADHPQTVRRLVLDGLAIYTPAERQEMEAHYAPPLAPEPDAAHWVRGWAMLRNMHIFWPWFRRDRHSRIVADLPSAEALHAAFVDFLRAVPDYWKGFQAAFAFDSLAALQRVSQPVLLTAAADDPLAAHLGRTGGLPATITKQGPAGDVAPLILDFLGGDSLPAAPPKPAVVPKAGVVRRDYRETRIGQILMRRSGEGAGRPVLMFHGSPGTSRSLERLLVEMGTDRPAVTFDTPGLGDSAPPPDGSTITGVAAIIGDAIDALGFDEFDVYGTRTGSCIGIELAIARPRQVKRVIVDGPVMFTDEYLDYMLPRYLPIITPHESGMHLLLTWNFRRDQGLFWPWFEHSAEGVRGRLAFTSDAEAANLTGEALHRNFSDFLKSALTYHIPYGAGIRFPTRERLPLVTQPVLVCTNEHDVFRPGMGEARVLPQHPVSRIYPDAGPPGAMETMTDLFRRFLAGEELPPLLGEE